jgi:hypothetical protein
MTYKLHINFRDQTKKSIEFKKLEPEEIRNLISVYMFIARDFYIVVDEKFYEFKTYGDNNGNWDVWIYGIDDKNKINNKKKTKK